MHCSLTFCSAVSTFIGPFFFPFADGNPAEFSYINSTLANPNPSCRQAKQMIPNPNPS